MRRTAKEMFPLVEQYQMSDLDKGEFCEAHGLKIATFGYWVTKYNQEIGARNFIPLEMSSSNMVSNYLMEMELTDGTILRFREQVSATYIGQILGVR